MLAYFIGSDCDENYARQQLATKKMPTMTSSSPHVATVRTSDRNGDRRVAHNMASGFKRNDKLSEKIGEKFDDYVDNYMEAALDY